ncbi:MAG TPA: ribonuclease P protein component [bacterium]|nr:ribonuclease P protein component [bacterium]
MLPKNNRLNEARGFQDILKNGKKIERNLVFIRYKFIAENKLGVIVSTKVSKLAVQRNRIKRLIREVVAKEVFNKKKRLGLVIVAKKEIAEMDYLQIRNDILTAINNI